ncbi:MAG: hypothetical protein QXV84_00255 [Conexivisphaerales archaeon]
MIDIVPASSIHDFGSLTIGIEELDEIIGKISPGSICLFYGNSTMIDEMVHIMIVRGCMLGKVAYMNNTNYHTAKTLIDLDKIASYAKQQGIEAVEVFKKTYFVAAYNQYRQPKATDILAQAIREDTSLIIVHNITKFIEGSNDDAAKALETSLAKLLHVAAKMSATMLITADAKEVSNKIPLPKADGLLYASNIIVFFRDLEQGSVHVTVVKHPEKQTPISFIISKNCESLACNTKSFRQMYVELISKLRICYMQLLRSKENSQAFESLIKVWDQEELAMARSELPLAIDAMNLTANVANRAEIEKLKERIEKLEKMMLV